MKQLNKHLKTQTTALNLFLQAMFSIVMGLILIYNYNLFFTRVSIVVFGYFWFVMGMNFLQVIQNIDKGIKDIIHELFPFFAFGVAIAIYFSNINRVIGLIPPIMILGTIFLAINNLICFFQYRNEKNTAPFRYLLSALLHLGFGVFFALYTYHYGHFFTGIRLIGLYLILLGVTIFLDGLAKAIPNQYINKWTETMRMKQPTLVAAFVPLTTLNRIRDYFRVNTDEIQPIKIQKYEGEANVEVYVHVAKSLRGIAGHVDIAIGDTVVCYGTYDRESIQLGGIIGAGVIYEVYDKEIYREFCQEVRNETLFEYGFVFSAEEYQRIEEKLEEIKARTAVWKCKAQRAKERNEMVTETKDMSCKLAVAMETVFYKFKSGAYKYYWMFGSNCVSFTDELVKASGMKTLSSGIFTPGTYFTFLNDEFAKGNSKIVSRTVYYTEDK